MIVAVPAVIALAVTVEPPTQRLAKVSELLGSASYASYTLHLPLLIIVQATAPRAFATATAPLLGVLFTAGVFVLAFLADNYYDRPVRRALGAMLKSRQRPAWLNLPLKL